ncbi:protein kinase (plasmid) [Gemmatirosa kalamazoonensis]|uniref:Protein kinase n=1 Tax=Gemmatirosa kalamazoonensis TaxID=861299 RepID=W0RS90_9BACT|nr:serine/threonine-protein kinase [Gemmatirosa kalamazoonensis]AHG93844.1 protein kinase [Gemmatirosa kalamazoonensis]
MTTLTRACTGCGAHLPPDAAYCPTCGTAATSVYAREPRRAAPEPEVRDRLQRALGPAWEIRWLVGRGGFAEVYAAWDSQLKRQVAIKTLRADLATNALVRERFRLEAETVAQLRHPHVVPIYAVGDADDVVYFVMPLIDGEHVAAAVRREGTLGVDESVRVLREAAGALHAAHRAGVVHRDVKPENLMLEGPERRVVVMDFGIAKIADAVDMNLTHTGFVMGSPQFMSPEQSAGERNLDHRTDQYALATVGFLMLTGRLPFEAESFQSYLYQQATQPAPRADALRADVPAVLADALARALARDPADRFPSMDAFAAALGESVATTPAFGTRRRWPSRDARAAAVRALLARWRRPAGVAAVVGAALTAASGGALSPAAGVRQASAREAAVAAAERAMRAEGAPAGLAERAELVQRDSLLRWLGGALGTAGAAARAERDGTGWAWRVSAYDRARDEVWQVTVAGAGTRVTGLERIAPDTTSWGARLSPAAARTLAERTLAVHGWHVDSLRPIAATVPRADHAFAWRVPGSTVRSARGDSVTTRVTVGVRGAHVALYRESADLPAGAPSAWHDLWLEWKGGSLVGLAVLVFSIATAVGVRRSRVDDVQWGLGLRLALPGVLALLAAMVRTVWLDASAPSTADTHGWVSETIGFVVSAPALLCALAGALAAAESLSHQRAPLLFAGTRDAVRARWDAPELPAAALLGTAAALLGTGLEAAVAWLAQRAGEWSGALPNAFELTVPPLALVNGILGGTLVVAAMALAFAAAAARRLPAVVPFAAVAAVATLGALPVDGPITAAYGVAWMLLLAFVVWRFGVLAGLVAAFVYAGLPDAVALLRADTSAFALWGVVALGVLAAPSMLGAAALKRRR